MFFLCPESFIWATFRRNELFCLAEEIPSIIVFRLWQLNSLHFATFPVLFHGIFHHKLRKRTNDCYIIYDLGTILMSMDLQCINLVFGLENVEVNLVMVSEIPFSLSWLEIRHLLKGLQNTSRCHRKVKEFSQRKQTLAALVFQFLNLVGRYQ